MYVDILILTYETLIRSVKTHYQSKKKQKQWCDGWCLEIYGKYSSQYEMQSWL